MLIFFLFFIFFTGMFQCIQGKKCIDFQLVCDGTPQCPDHSDEAGCWKPTKSCSIRCDGNSHCIPEVFMCNGMRDCWDGSDEADCGEFAVDASEITHLLLHMGSKT